MIILAFDSTAKCASVAVSDDERLLALYNIDNGLTQSELLLPMAENMLKSLHLTFDDVDLYTCSVGPGSFTGVRIGVSLIKGLAFGKNKPCVSVSTLDALAENAIGLCGIILPCMDARRGQVYSATYVCENGELVKKTNDRAIAVSDLIEEMKNETLPIYIVGDGYSGVYKAFSESGLNVRKTPTLLINENAYSCVKVAFRKFSSGEVSTDLEIAPTYLRIPQAERERLERLKLEKETK